MAIHAVKTDAGKAADDREDLHNAAAVARSRAWVPMRGDAVRRIRVTRFNDRRVGGGGREWVSHDIALLSNWSNQFTPEAGEAN